MGTPKMIDSMTLVMPRYHASQTGRTSATPPAAELPPTRCNYSVEQTVYPLAPSTSALRFRRTFPPRSSADHGYHQILCRRAAKGLDRVRKDNLRQFFPQAAPGQAGRKQDRRHCRPQRQQDQLLAFFFCRVITSYAHRLTTGDVFFGCSHRYSSSQRVHPTPDAPGCYFPNPSRCFFIRTSHEQLFRTSH